MLQSHHQNIVKNGKKLQKKTDIQATSNKLMLLKYADPFIHTPIELLHTALLGVACYLVTELQKEVRKDGFLMPQQRSVMSAWIDAMYQRDALNHVTAANLIEFCNTFVGREYKLIMEYGFYLFRRVLTKRADGQEDLPPLDPTYDGHQRRRPQEGYNNIDEQSTDGSMDSDAEVDENDVEITAPVDIPPDHDDDDEDEEDYDVSDDESIPDHPEMSSETATGRRGRLHREIIVPENPRRRHRNLDDMFLEEPDEDYVEQEN
jgi:hypothetical protein